MKPGAIFCGLIIVTSLGLCGIDYYVMKKDAPVKYHDDDHVYAIVKSLKNQSALVPLEAEYSTPETSSLSRYGMTAQVTTILSGKIEYRVDMSKINTSIKDKHINVILPDVELTVPTIDIQDVVSYDNSSLMFANSDVKPDLVKHNVEIGRAKIFTLAKNNKDRAKANAVSTITNILQFSRNLGYTLEVK